MPTRTPVSTDATSGRIAGGPVTFAGIASTRGELLRSPVSDAPCVYWRLRISERVNASLQLVHEIASTEDFELTWSGTEKQVSLATTRPVRIRVAAQTARIQATPVLHRPGSPGAIVTGRQFGFTGQLSVEEVALRPGEEITANGVLEEPAGSTSGPFRAVEHEIELLDATVRVPARTSIGPALLPWALGTTAALLGSMAAATWAAWRFDLLPHLQHGVASPPAEVGPYRSSRRHFSRPD
jgi:hypothetical protein